MPFIWQISINKNPAGKPRIKFDPNPLNNVAVGDQIIWTNNDDQPHWPALQKSDGTIDQNFFMENQIAPHSPSNTFVAGTNGVLNYLDSLEKNATGTIYVS